MSDDRAYDEPLPWLAAVEDEDEPRGVSARRMLAALAVVILAGLIVAGDVLLAWPARHRGQRAARADRGASRALQDQAAESGRPRHQGVKARPPSKPARARITTPSSTSTSCPKHRSPSRRRRPRSRRPATQDQPKSRRAGSKPAAAASSGSVVQLGAFANQAQAERAWTALSARFPAVASIGQADCPLHGRHPAPRRRGVAGGCPAAVPDDEGGGRELLRCALTADRCRPPSTVSKDST